VFARKEGPLADNFITFFYEGTARRLFQPIDTLQSDESKLMNILPTSGQADGI
jgi:hypothetical protein